MKTICFSSLKGGSGKSSLSILTADILSRSGKRVLALSPCSTRQTVVRAYYRLPLARLWGMHSIWQFAAELMPPLLHAETWSASISANFHILLLFASWPMAQRNKLRLPQDTAWRFGMSGPDPLCRSKLAEVLEKVIKAQLLRQGWFLERTHDLLKLAGELEARNSDLI